MYVRTIPTLGHTSNAQRTLSNTSFTASLRPRELMCAWASTMAGERGARSHSRPPAGARLLYSTSTCFTLALLPELVTTRAHQQVRWMYLLYWYKSTNTDAKVLHVGMGAAARYDSRPRGMRRVYLLYQYKSTNTDAWVPQLATTLVHEGCVVCSAPHQQVLNLLALLVRKYKN